MPNVGADINTIESYKQTVVLFVTISVVLLSVRPLGEDTPENISLCDSQGPFAHSLFQDMLERRIFFVSCGYGLCARWASYKNRIHTSLVPSHDHSKKDMFVLCYNLIHCLVVLDRLQISVKGPYDSHDVTDVLRCVSFGP